MPMTLLAIWILVTLGLTYAARTATLLATPRLYLIARFPRLANLLGCGWCTSWWTGQAAYLGLFPVLYVLLEVDPWWLLASPLAGLAGTGLWELREALSPSAAARTLTRLFRSEGP